MNKLRIVFAVVLSAAFIFTGCAIWNKTQTGAVAGTATTGPAGEIIGRTSGGNTALGAITRAAVGGAAGAVIGRQMDKQAEEIKKSLPDAKVERVGEGIVVEFSSNLLFAFDKSNLSDDAKTNLGKLVVVLNSYPDTDIEIQGHTDNKGSETYNQILSEQRARIVSAYLTNNGIYFKRLTIKGFGEKIPKYSNDSNEGQIQNRRVELMITANEKMKADAQQNIVD